VDAKASAAADGPLVSILTPSLNQARFVSDCLESIDSQDYPRIEHVVVDGGSTDGTLDVLRQAANGGLHLIVERSSQSAALNRALECSSGEIVGWLNTDDAYLGVDAVGSAVEALAGRPDAVAAYGDAVVAGADGRLLRHVATDAARLDRLEPFSPLVQPAVFFRRDAVADGFLREDLDLTMDYELWVRLRRKGAFARIDRILAVDRDHVDAKSRARMDELADELRRVAALHGVPLDERGRLRRQLHALGRRAGGLLPMLRIERDYELAYPARVDSRWRRAVRQLALPQRLLANI
jgi:glycosyltransferase involved in cell wall biosynthesis